MAEEKNNTILIRSMTDEQVKELETYKNKYGHKTNSKAVLKILERVNYREQLIDEQRQKITDLEGELISLKASIRTYLNAFEILKRQSNE